MRDLEIRGAGNILGKEQSGMIYQVGYELYTQMLEEATNEYKGEIKEVTFDTVIDFKHNLFIPDEYISDAKEKISVYKLIMRSQSDEDIDTAKEYMIDKYGKMPKEIEDIFNIAKLKVILKRVRVLSVIEGHYNIYLKLDKYSKIDTNKVSKLVSLQGSGVYFDKENLNQLIIPVVDDSLIWKINKVSEVILEIESSEEYKETKEKSLVDVNLESQKKNKQNNIRKRKIIKINKRANNN